MQSENGREGPLPTSSIQITSPLLFRLPTTMAAYALLIGYTAFSWAPLDGDLESRKHANQRSFLFLPPLILLGLVWIRVEWYYENLREDLADGDPRERYSLVTPLRPSFSNAFWLFPLRYLTFFAVLLVVRWVLWAQECLYLESFVEEEWQFVAGVVCLAILPFSAVYYLESPTSPLPEEMSWTAIVSNRKGKNNSDG